MRHAPQGQPAYPSHPSSRRGSEADYSMQAAAAAAMDDDSSVVSRASRQSYDNDDNGRHHDPEARIAAIKAQRDRDRQRENAEKEEQVCEIEKLESLHAEHPSLFNRTFLRLNKLLRRTETLAGRPRAANPPLPSTSTSAETAHRAWPLPRRRR